MLTVFFSIWAPDKGIPIPWAVMHAHKTGVYCSYASSLHKKAASSLPGQCDQVVPFILKAFVESAPEHIIRVLLPCPPIGKKPFCQIVHRPGQGTNPNFSSMVVRNSSTVISYSFAIHSSQTMDLYPSAQDTLLSQELVSSAPHTGQAISYQYNLLRLE